MERNVLCTEQLEGSDRQYHALVAAIQLDTQREIQEFRAEVRVEEERAIDNELDTPAHEIQERYAAYVTEGVAALRVESREKIQKEVQERQRRDQEILSRFS